MTSIDIAGKLGALVRDQATALQAQGKAGDSKRAGKESSTGKTARRADDWMAQVSLTISAISADDPQRRGKAFRAYLASALSRELGITQVHGSEFQHLLDKVQETMNADTELKKAIDQAGDMLLRQVADKS